MQVLHDILEPVLRDVRATTDLRLRVQEAGALEGRISGLVLTEEAGATGIYVAEHDTLVEQVASAASQVQDVVTEELGARASNWPMCPTHRSSHPLEAVARQDGAWWACPADGAQVSPIGDLQL